MVDEMKRIILCKYCNKPEYYGEYRWLSGKMLCRDCYKAHWEDVNHELYRWSDLNGDRPSMKDYEQQEEREIK